MKMFEISYTEAKQNAKKFSGYDLSLDEYIRDEMDVLEENVLEEVGGVYDLLNEFIEQLDHFVKIGYLTESEAGYYEDVANNRCLFL